MKERAFFTEIKKTNYYKKITNKLNYPRVKGYADVKNIGKWMAVQLYGIEILVKGKTEDFAQSCASIAAGYIFSEIVPIYWLEKSLAESLLMTQLPRVRI